MRGKKLLIISHTEHYLNTNQQIVGWGSTITEINYLADFWDEVIHIGCFYKKPAPEVALPYTKSNIHFVSIPSFGGKTIFDKVGILFRIPNIIATVIRYQKDVTEVQLRLPTSMGLFLLPLFSFFLSRKYTFWIKYAGNWSQVNPPLSSKIQRWWLDNNFAKSNVTINGFWPNQPKNCISFENPCLTQKDILKGKAIGLTKRFNEKFNLMFIGRLEDAKGMTIILDALKTIDLTKINQIHFIGDSNQRNYFEEKAIFLQNKAIFHGFLSSDKVHQLLGKAHFILLPSKSEGFPKVIAEAACYGVIPISSDVGSISHYINEANGFVWEYNGVVPFGTVLKQALETNPDQLAQISQNVIPLAELFTFENYRSKLQQYILNSTAAEQDNN